jgi:hypothetical protein
VQVDNRSAKFKYMSYSPCQFGGLESLPTWQTSDVDLDLPNWQIRKVNVAKNSPANNHLVKTLNTLLISQGPTLC